MNRKQTAVLWGCVVLVGFCIAVPPYAEVLGGDPLVTEFLGYYLLASPPEVGPPVRIDTQRLLMQVGFVAVVGGALFYTLED
jgi:hypothetical protein